MIKTLAMKSLETVMYPSTNRINQVSDAVTNEHGDRVAEAIEPAAETAPAADARISAAAALVAEALKGDDVRWEKVAELRQRISAGTYHVSSVEIADRMIEALSR